MAKFIILAFVLLLVVYVARQRRSKFTWNAQQVKRYKVLSAVGAVLTLAAHLAIQPPATSPIDIVLNIAFLYSVYKLAKAFYRGADLLRANASAASAG